MSQRISRPLVHLPASVTFNLSQLARTCVAKYTLQPVGENNNIPPKRESLNTGKPTILGRMKNRFYFIATAAALIGLAPASHATAIYSTLGPGGSFNTNNYVEIGPSTIIPTATAAEFTTPVNATVGSVTLALTGSLPIPLDQSLDLLPFSISIDTSGPGGPTNIVGSFGLVDVAQTGLYTYSSTTPFQLNAGTEYWLTVSLVAAFPLGWYLNNQGIDGVGANGSELGVWTDYSGTAPAFEVDTVPEPGSAALCAATLVTACLWRKRTASTRRLK